MRTALALMVMPFSRSRSMRSSTCSAISRWAMVPVSSSRRSARVDLPWSMCAMMQKLRICGAERAVSILGLGDPISHLHIHCCRTILGEMPRLLGNSVHRTESIQHTSGLPKIDWVLAVFERWFSANGVSA